MPRKRKPFVPVEIEFIQLISKYISAKTGISKREVIGAAAEMWNECISAGKAEIHPLILCMYFPPETHDALIEFELLSKTESGFLVRGVVKHLDAIKAKKEGASITNAKKTEAEQERGAKRTFEQSGNVKGTGAEQERGAKRGAKRTEDNERYAKRTASVPQNTEYRTQNTEDKNTRAQADFLEPDGPEPQRHQKKPAAKKAQVGKADSEGGDGESSSLYRELVAALCEEYLEVTGEKYLFQGGKDGAALKALLSKVEPESVYEKWCIGLRLEGFYKVRSIAELLSKFNGIEKPKPKRDPLAGYERA